MGLPLILIALAVPVWAQLGSLELSFTGIECASCLDSLPARILRMRGVESAHVDASNQILAVKFAAGNRIRLEQIRDAIEQDGTRVRRASLTVRGGLGEEAGRWVLKLPNGSQFEISLDGAPPSAQYSLKPGAVSVSGVVGNLRPASGLMVITPKSVESVDQ